MAWYILLALRRLRARWRSLLTLIIGVFLAAIIGANASLYTTAIAQVGMTQFLETQASDDTNVISRTSLSPSATDDFAAEWAAYDASYEEQFAAVFTGYEAWAGLSFAWAETQSLYPMRAGEDIEGARVRVAYYETLADYAELVDGEWASDGSDNTAQFEFVVSVATAQAMNLAVGDIIELDQRGWDTSQIFTGRVSGIIQAQDAKDAYWFDPSPLRTNGASPNSLEPNFLTTQAAFNRVIPENIPQPPVQLGWRIAFQHEQLPFSNIKSALAQLDIFEGEITRTFLANEAAQGSFVYTTDLPTILTEYSEQIVYLNIPFGLLLIQLSALVLFFLVLIAALVRRSEQREIAMLQSRGAPDRQIILVRGIEALIICLAATVLAPPLARQGLLWLVPIFTGITDFPLELNLNVFLFAGLASFAAFVMLMLTLLPILRQPLILAGGSGSRSATQTWWQRYYLDVVLLIVGGAALFQITRSQSLVANTPTGQTQADPLLLLAPTLMFVAFSSILLRFFPGVMNIAANFFSTRRNVEGALASWQVSREPLHYGRIAFLLALAIGIGWFAISYQATIISNQNDQARYLVGSDVRVVYDEPDNPDVAESMARIAALPEVAGITRVMRVGLPNIATGGQRRSRQAGDLLAVDSATFHDVLYWRDDLNALDVPPSRFDITQAIGREISAETRQLDLWLLAEGRLRINFGIYTPDLRVYPRIFDFARSFSATVRDANGQTYYVPVEIDRTELSAYIAELLAASEIDQFTLFTPIDTDEDGSVDDLEPLNFPNGGWMHATIDLTEIEADGTLYFESLSIVLPQPFDVENIRLTISDFLAPEPLYWTKGDWDISVAPSSYGPTNYTLTDIPVLFGNQGLVLNWHAQGSSFGGDIAAFTLLLDYPKLADVEVASRASRPTPPEESSEDEIIGMPVLVSNSFAALNEFANDQRFTLFMANVSPWFELDATNSYFPTLYQDRPYVVVEQSTLDYTLNRATNAAIPVNELWIRLETSTDEREFVARLRQSGDAPLFDTIYSRLEVLDSYETDVLSLGVIGLLFISSLVGLSLSVVSLFTYISLTVQSRMKEFAVLRALGLPNWRIVVSIVIEQGLVLIVAIVLGAIIGEFLTLQVLPPLALSAAGGSVTPPYIIRTDWLAIAQYLLLIVVVLAFVLLLSAIWVRRTANVQALNLAEE